MFSYINKQIQFYFSKLKGINTQQLYATIKLHDIKIVDFPSQILVNLIQAFVKKTNGSISFDYKDNKLNLNWKNMQNFDPVVSILHMVESFNDALIAEQCVPLNVVINFSKDKDNLKILENFSLIYNVDLVFDERIFDENILELDQIQTVRIYTLVKPDLEIKFKQHEKFLTAYRDKRFEMAILIATSLKSSFSYKLKNYYSIMIAKCKNSQ